MGIEIDTSKRSGFVCYTGGRDELIAAGVAVDAMFPPAPKTRRYWKGLSNPPVADAFKTTKVGARWRVSRELGWEDQDFIREQHAARDAEREAREAREAHDRAAAQVEKEIAQMPDDAAGFRREKAYVIVPFLAAVGGRGMDHLGGYYFDDATIEEVHDLLHEIAATIAKADVRFSPAKRMVEEATLRASLLTEAESD
ncbi:MAG: hypothetical protein IT518_09770 [Burkholderiales bacterium]|nr:hypothetical protein [Burkholderiales bacterium]